MKKGGAVTAIVLGIILIVLGIVIRIPSKELTTYKLLEGEYSIIDEYVGGDAYNYIIGASLVAGNIAAAKISKSLFIAVGVLVMCIGLIANNYADSNHNVGLGADDINKQETTVPEELPEI